MTAKNTPASGHKPVVFSGVQPTNRLMLGTYLGALRNWKIMLDAYDCIFCVVNQHAITVKQDPKELKRRSYETLAMYLACGIDPKKCILFLQSHVPQHAQLAWMLECHAYMGELSRMTQFKDKSAKHENIGTGLFTYPVLMAADILLYQTERVPVGLDQKQHLELARDLAVRMNNSYGTLFKVPEPHIAPIGAKIMSLQDPTKKMSKSDEVPNATVFLDESDDEIMKKVKRAVTDSGTEIAFSDDKPGIKNLIMIQAAITGKTTDAIVAEYQGKQYGHLKVGTAEIIIECLRPIRERFQDFMKDTAELDRIFHAGAQAAGARAEKTLKKVSDALGFLA